ncbi:MAG TPA: histidine phosphatase family protein [Patescibacteria group bacterium]|nr:histidine phosphatase family protein [Patescibacteria group bacterium]
MKIYFVRHGESVSNALGLRQGPDGGLTAKGIKQAKILAKKFSKIPVDLIVSSPYDRAKLTAQIISKAIGKKNRLLSAFYRTAKSCPSLWQTD